MKFTEPLLFWCFFLLLFASQPYYFHTKIVFKINKANVSSTLTSWMLFFHVLIFHNLIAGTQSVVIMLAQKYF
jgi:hypothetical protein